MVVDNNTGGLVVGNNIAFDHYVVGSHHQNTCARRDTRDNRARCAKVGCVVIQYKIIADNHIFGGFNWQAWGNKGQNAARVIVGNIVFHHRVAAIFNFYAGHAIEHLVVGHMDIVAHTYIDSGIRNT